MSYTLCYCLTKDKTSSSPNHALNNQGSALRPVYYGMCTPNMLCSPCLTWGGFVCTAHHEFTCCASFPPSHLLSLLKCFDFHSDHVAYQLYILRNKKWTSTRFVCLFVCMPLCDLLFFFIDFSKYMNLLKYTYCFLIIAPGDIQRENTKSNVSTNFFQ